MRELLASASGLDFVVQIKEFVDVRYPLVCKDVFGKAEGGGLRALAVLLNGVLGEGKGFLEAGCELVGGFGMEAWIRISLTI